MLIKEVSSNMAGKVMLDTDEISIACTCRGIKGIVLAHNHPSGINRPSLDDLEMTKRIADFFRINGITVLDHFIVTDEGYYSMRVHELL